MTPKQPFKLDQILRIDGIWCKTIGYFGRETLWICLPVKGPTNDKPANRPIFMWDTITQTKKA